ncbi:MAG: RagB/SusD family nutrient uptake outer membrane protein [Clostridium sp.]|nr:RagB/SusD family nutrient uptake outer membrane protein [Clostridium sp.]
MKTYIKALVLGAAIAGLTSCDDFLDRMPESSLTGEGFFNDASELATYSIKYYANFPVSTGYDYGTFASDNGTDTQAGISASTAYMPGEWKVGSGAWSFTTIRQINYFFDMVQPKYDAGAITGSKEEIDQYMGEMHFFRAWNFFSGYNTYGDYPIYKVLPSENKEELLQLSHRYPRNKVARFILDELTEAIRLLPETSKYGKQGLNKDCARLFRSRVALFEGTWLKYHKGTALVPGGPGWPGDQADLEGFNIDDEIQYFLGEAMTSAKEVADKIAGDLVENTDTPEGMDANLNSLNPYYTMFCDVDMNGYNEVLLWKKFDLGKQVTTNVQMQMMRNGGNTGWTRGMVNSFLMRNGLPIYAAGSGYDSNWENDGVSATLQGRDSRLQIFTKGDHSVDYYLNGDTAYWREGWLLEGASDNTRAVTGYCIKKGKHYNGEWANVHYVGLSGSIVFRATEAMLNYMEAQYEHDGNINSTTENYWKALRRRAKVDEDYTKTIANTNMSEEAKWDWGAYSHGNLINTTLYNIRRERRNELCAEAHRYDDLRRWCAMDQLMTNPYQIEGIKYWGTVYADPNNTMCLKRSNGEVLLPTVNLTDGGDMSDEAISGPYVRPYQITRVQNLAFDGLRWTRAHYLSPIPQKSFSDASPDETLANSVIYQNPGWSKISGEAAESLD